MKILAIDGDAGMRRLVKGELDNAGYNVSTFATGREALDELERGQVDLVLVDASLPDMPVGTLIQQVRDRDDLPVVVLGEVPLAIDRARLLHAGADVVVEKPVSPDELVAQLAATLRRTLRTPSAGQMVKVGDVEVDLVGRVARLKGDPVNLSRTEWLLLQQLAVNAGRVVLSRELLVKLWGEAYADNFKYLRVWISRLRAKLEDDPRQPKVILTYQGVGYLLGQDKEDEHGIHD